MMTKKHFKAIARIIESSTNRPVADPNGVDPHCMYAKGLFWARRHITQNLANYFETTNPRFDRDKFIKACGL